MEMSGGESRGEGGDGWVCGKGFGREGWMGWVGSCAEEVSVKV